MATPEHQSAYDVFVSYSHEDEQWVQSELLPRLKNAGLKVCIDSESYQRGEPFEAGTPLIRAIEKAILVSHKTICVFSPTYSGSEWCELEDILISSLDPSGREKRLLPILLEPCDLPPRIKARLYVDFVAVGTNDQAWGRLLAALGGLTAAVGKVEEKPLAMPQAEATPLVEAQAQLERQQAQERERREEEARQAEQKEKVATLYAEAQGHLKAGRWSEAIAGFQGVLELVPTHGVAARKLAQAQAELERREAEERKQREEQARQAELAQARQAQKQEARRQAQTPAVGAAPQAGATKTLEAAGIILVYVPAGEFLMGSPGMGGFGEVLLSLWDGRHGESPEHRVYLDGYWIGRTEVTNAQYRKFVEAGGYSARKYWTDDGWQWKEGNGITQPEYWTHSAWNGADYPVVGVSWHEAVAFAKWAGARLPTEAEWEYAARGGANGHGYLFAGSNDANEVAWYNGNSYGPTTNPVGQKKPNELGLYDMSGNVWEWVADWYDSVYYSQSPKRNPTGPRTDEFRVMRGGSWFIRRGLARCAVRDWSGPDDRLDLLGFRVAE